VKHSQEFFAPISQETYLEQFRPASPEKREGFRDLSPIRLRPIGNDMRLVSFFVLSLALHATALVYPAYLGSRSQAQLIQLTILPMEQEGGGAGGQEGNGMPTRRGDSKSHRAAPPAEPRIEPKSLASPEPQGLPADTLATLNDSSIAMVSALANSAETVGAAISGPAGNDANGTGNGLGGIGSSNGVGSSGTGYGRGSGNGNGSSSPGTGIALTQARYRDTPTPDYPDSARREGREGRVLLRVLVDAQGRSKQVEINSSSGSEALDRAAAETIKRWQFHPARHGDQPVESWLRVPIEFRLADANSH
jgi:protein TonB